MKTTTKTQRAQGDKRDGNIDLSFPHVLCAFVVKGLTAPS